MMTGEFDKAKKAQMPSGRSSAQKTIEDKKSGKGGGKGGKTGKGKKRAGDIDLEELDLNKDERKLAEAALKKKQYSKTSQNTLNKIVKELTGVPKIESQIKKNGAIIGTKQIANFKKHKADLAKARNSFNEYCTNHVNSDPFHFLTGEPEEELDTAKSALATYLKTKRVIETCLD